MAVFTMADAKFYIGSKTGNATSSELSDFTSDIYVEVGEVSNLQGLVDVQNFASFTALGDRRSRQLKTTVAAENVTITCGFDGADLGQIALRAAAADRTNDDYNFKVVYVDGTVAYWAGAAGNDPLPGGTAEDVATVDYVATNNTGFYIDLSASS